MAKKPAQEEPELTFFARPAVGSLFTVLSALSFLFLCMILPIVGSAAAHGSGSPGATTAEHYAKNFWAFLGVLLGALALAALAVVSKMERRKVDGSPMPLYSVGLVVLLVFMLIALLSGALAW